MQKNVFLPAWGSQVQVCGAGGKGSVGKRSISVMLLKVPVSSDLFLHVFNNFDSVGQVESDINFPFALEYCSMFCDDFPRVKELEANIALCISFQVKRDRPQKLFSAFNCYSFQAALTWASTLYRLNPWKESSKHQAAVEAVCPPCQAMQIN